MTNEPPEWKRCGWRVARGHDIYGVATDQVRVSDGVVWFYLAWELYDELDDAAFATIAEANRRYILTKGPSDPGVHVPGALSTPIPETVMTDIDNARLQMRMEYLRSIPDAYAGSATIKERCWNRLLEQIDAYAEAYADFRAAVRSEIADAYDVPTQVPSDPAPTMSPAPEPSADPGWVDGGDAPQEPATRPARGRKRTTPAQADQSAPTTPETESGEDTTP